MRKLLPVLLLCCLPAMASKKPNPADYQDAVLVSFTTVKTGDSCGASVSDNNLGTIGAKTTGTMNCTSSGTVHYTIKMGNQTLVLSPQLRSWNRNSVLFNHLPGAHIQVRFSHKGLYVKADGQESRFDIVEAH